MKWYSDESKYESVPNNKIRFWRGARYFNETRMVKGAETDMWYADDIPVWWITAIHAWIMPKNSWDVVPSDDEQKGACKGARLGVIDRINSSFDKDPDPRKPDEVIRSIELVLVVRGKEFVAGVGTEGYSGKRANMVNLVRMLTFTEYRERYMKLVGHLDEKVIILISTLAKFFIANYGDGDLNTDRQKNGEGIGYRLVMSLSEVPTFSNPDAMLKELEDLSWLEDISTIRSPLNLNLHYLLDPTEPLGSDVQDALKKFLGAFMSKRADTADRNLRVNFMKRAEGPTNSLEKMMLFACYLVILTRAERDTFMQESNERLKSLFSFGEEPHAVVVTAHTKSLAKKLPQELQGDKNNDEAQVVYLTVRHRWDGVIAIPSVPLTSGTIKPESQECKDLRKHVNELEVLFENATQAVSSLDSELDKVLHDLTTEQSVTAELRAEVEKLRADAEKCRVDAASAKKKMIATARFESMQSMFG